MNHLITVFALLAFALPAAAGTTAIVGGKVHTVGPQGTIENATVLIVDGRIAAVGTDVSVVFETHAELAVTTNHRFDGKAHARREW